MGEAFGYFLILLLFIVGALAVFITNMIIDIIGRKISEELENSEAPVQTVSARIVCKHTAVLGIPGSLRLNRMFKDVTVTAKHYVTFEEPDGFRLDLQVKGSEYGMLAEGDYGELTFQRKRYIGFNRQATPEQMLYAQQIQEQQRLIQAMQEQMRYGQMLPQNTPQNFIQTNDGDQRAQF